MHFFITLRVQNSIYLFAFLDFMDMYCFYMYHYVLHRLSFLLLLLLLLLFVCLIITLFFIHKDCLETYCFSLFLINMHLML